MAKYSGPRPTRPLRRKPRGKRKLPRKRLSTTRINQSRRENSALLFVVNRPVPRALSVFVYSTIEKLHYSAVIGYDGSGLSYNLTVSLGSPQKRMRAHSLHNKVSSC